MRLGLSPPWMQRSSGSPGHAELQVVQACCHSRAAPISSPMVACIASRALRPRFGSTNGRLPPRSRCAPSSPCRRGDLLVGAGRPGRSPWRDPAPVRFSARAVKAGHRAFLVAGGEDHQRLAERLVEQRQQGLDGQREEALHVVVRRGRTSGRRARPRRAADRRSTGASS